MQCLSTPCSQVSSFRDQADMLEKGGDRYQPEINFAHAVRTSRHISAKVCTATGLHCLHNAHRHSRWHQTSL